MLRCMLLCGHFVASLAAALGVVALVTTASTPRRRLELLEASSCSPSCWVAKLPTGSNSAAASACTGGACCGGSGLGSGGGGSGLGAPLPFSWSQLAAWLWRRDLSCSKWLGPTCPAFIC